MDPRLLYIYVSAIRDEVYAASNAHWRIRELSAKLRRTDDWDMSSDIADLELVELQDQLGAAIEGLLSAHARLSLFFFPSSRAGARGNTRARELRQLFRLSEESSLGSREPRNTWMHIDEVIDQQVWERQADDIVVTVFGDSRLARIDEIDRRIVRLIDPTRHTISILGTPFHLDDLYAQVSEVATHLQEVENTVGTLAGIFLNPEEPPVVERDADRRG